MRNLCTACGVEFAMTRRTVCRFCDTVGWQPTALEDPAAEPDAPEAASRWWLVLGLLGCLLAWSLLIAFLRAIP
jgi:hypothetical protein